MPPETIPAAIRVQGLNKWFGRKQVLEHIDFTVPAGAVAGFLGPNGAGKTTTLRILLGLARAYNGTMEALGLPMPSCRTAAMEQIGTLVEQPAFLDSMSGAKNLWWFGNLYQPVTAERVREVLELVGLGEAASKPFGVYSTGMKQRLGVAAALLHRPKLLILDEPTNGMDPQGRAQMRDIFKQIHAETGVTIFLSSHLLDEIQRLCDYVVIIDRGKTVREGWVKDILRGDIECWEVRFPAPDTDRVRGLLKNLGCVQAVNDVPRGLELTLTPGSSAEVVRLLVESKVAVQAVIPRESSLEETFLALTETKGL
ncbi:MAG TPA: ABC transporter ATP-binding protein [Candidatus Ozemobacteraceae bacterium]|nr:ABC transporter ATP-binding protein [Candidatus Ozemobacteraceae bacterium]